MDAIVISDLHLGAANCQAKAICKFLEHVRDEIKPSRLIVNGDLFDSFDSRLRKWHWEVLTDLRRMSDEMEVIWVQGNHDRDGPAAMVAQMFGASFYRRYYEFKSGKKKILCIHGDKWDKYTTDRPIITWFADQIYWFLQYIDRSFFLAKLAKKSSKMFLRNAEAVEEGALELREDREADIVVCGHTHHPIGKENYFNSGSWTEKPPSYLEVDGGVVYLKYYEPN